jgi:hypothetical protein
MATAISVAAAEHSDEECETDDSDDESEHRDPPWDTRRRVDCSEPREGV